jgi:hypothetical protein
MKAEEIRDDGAEQISKDEVIKRLQALEGKQVSPVLDIDAVEDGEELPFGDTDFK